MKQYYFLSRPFSSTIIRVPPEIQVHFCQVVYKDTFQDHGIINSDQAESPLVSPPNALQFQDHLLSMHSSELRSSISKDLNNANLKSFTLVYWPADLPLHDHL